MSRKSFVSIVLTCMLFLFAACTSKQTQVASLPTDTISPTDLPSPEIATLTPRPRPTNTPLPPTETLTPTATATLLPTDTPTPSETPTETVPPPTASGEDAIYVYYVLLDTGGPVACGDDLVKVNTGLFRSGDIATDITTALGRLFTKQQWVGNLYNPVYLSNWKIISVDYQPPNLADVSLEGAYVRSGDRCDDSRVRAQIWSTIRQFPGVKTAHVLLNGNLLGDILATGQ